MQQLRSFDRSLLDIAISQFGSTAKLAKACQVRTSAISNAKMRGTISPELALAIHWATKGKVSASALRPDLWHRPGHVPAERMGKRKKNGA